MKITVLQQDLYPQLQAVARSVGGKVSLPVLANILLEGTKGKLKLSATNLEIGIVKHINCQVEEEGAITIPARTLLEVISSLSGESINLEADEDKLKISTSNFSGSINGIPAAEFPNIPLSSANPFTIDGALLQQILPQITFAAASDEGRPVLTGILTEITGAKTDKKKTLKLVATDGFRLAYYSTEIEGLDSTGFKSLIPKKTFEELIKLISEDLKEKDDKKIGMSTADKGNQLIIKIAEAQVSSRLIEGQFPNWEKIVPTTFQSTVSIDRQNFLKAVKIASIFARDTANVIKIQLEEKGIKLLSEAKELGGQETAVDAQVEGEKLTIAFNSKFLIDVLSSVHTDKVVLSFSGNVSACLIKPEGFTGLEYVIMPIRLN